MASIMRLRPEHKQYHMVTSPLVVDAKELKPEEIERLVQAYLDAPTDQNREAALLAFGSIIRHIVGRYIGTFRSLKSMEDDLVSVAFMTVMDAIDKKVASEDVCRVVSNRILYKLARHVNKFRTISAPSMHTQQKRLNDGKDVLYAVPVDQSAHDRPEIDESLYEFEFLSALLDSDLTELEQRIIDPDNWGLNPRELAERLDVPERTMYRAFNNLLQKAKDILYAD